MSAQDRPCKRCKQMIPAERVAAMPGTSLCIKCSGEVGGEWQYSFTNENTAKTGSLKKELRRHQHPKETQTRRTDSKRG